MKHVFYYTFLEEILQLMQEGKKTQGYWICEMIADKRYNSEEGAQWWEDNKNFIVKLDSTIKKCMKVSGGVTLAKYLEARYPDIEYPELRIVWLSNLIRHHKGRSTM